MTHFDYSSPCRVLHEHLPATVSSTNNPISSNVFRATGTNAASHTLCREGRTPLLAVRHECRSGRDRSPESDPAHTLWLFGRHQAWSGGRICGGCGITVKGDPTLLDVSITEPHV
eukprot:Blabericola_migrator_1__549@NODE_1135_length_5322_cov_46_890200_g69_i2_p5_GENE_NODE_1135_length_5322_cov_46_890200_g69_i2NODE_1135_length_5322_cov_46_890200_g69_i2_p5_ORF_typecomplete_len115_score10_00Fer2_3/PF13085_6/1_9e02Fer2_3/PF13085_6/2_5_NODE_1135_length_5322_cov_46_890200_g69_i232793623